MTGTAQLSRDVLASPDEYRAILSRLNKTSTLLFATMAMADEDASATITAQFQADYLATSRGMSDARAFYAELGLAIERAERQIAAQRELIALYERRQAALEAQVFQVIEQLPGVTFRDEDGKKVYTAKNGQAELLVARSLGTKSVTDIVDSNDYYPPDVIETVTFTRLNRTKLRKYIEAGNPVAWAGLEHGRHLSGLKPPKKKKGE